MGGNQCMGNGIKTNDEEKKTVSRGESACVKIK
jgi:hypothetical protein